MLRSKECLTEFIKLREPTDVVAEPDPDGTKSLQVSPASLCDVLDDGLHIVYTLILQLQHRKLFFHHHHYHHHHQQANTAERSIVTGQKKSSHSFLRHKHNQK